MMMIVMMSMPMVMGMAVLVLMIVTMIMCHNTYSKLESHSRQDFTEIKVGRCDAAVKLNRNLKTFCPFGFSSCSKNSLTIFVFERVRDFFWHDLS
jgi:hypothetical protein